MEDMVNVKPVVAYLRVSTEEQTLENQRLAVEKWARDNGYLVTKYYEDFARSGAIPPLRREGFRKMIEEIPNLEPRPIAVLTYELSRIGRTFYETLEAINALEALGSPLMSISPREGFLQTLDPSIRKLILAILTWVAERERDLISQRTREGMERARREGKRVGRPKKEVSKARVEEYLKKGLSLSAISKIL
ncbi:MAG: recombinase family protein, partial [Thermoprotei archaeon]